MRRLACFLILVVMLVLFVTPAKAPAFECWDDLPWGWWHHPGLVRLCLLFEMIDQCEANFECWSDYWENH